MLRDGPALSKYVLEAKRQGCPKDQVENLIRFGQVLQPKQLLASAIARECDKGDGPICIGFGGARGPGKSHWAVVQVACDDCQRMPGLRVLLLRKVGKAAQEGFEAIRSRTLLGVPHKYNSSKGILSFPNGSTIILGHFKDEKDVDAYLGLEYDVIIVEEATTLSWTKVEAILTCNRTSNPDWRPRAYFTTNPGGIGHKWFKKMFVLPWREGTETETRFVPATAKDNRMLDKEYVRTKLETLTGWKRKAWLEGDFEIDAGLFFSNFNDQTHKVAAWQDIPGGAKLVLSLDHGWTHPTACHLGMVYDGKRYLVDECGGSKTLVKDHCKAILSMLDRYGLDLGSLSKMVAGPDIWAKREDKCIADTYADNGFQWEPAQNDRIQGAGAILDGFGDEASESEPTLFVTERCPMFLEQVAYMEHDPKRPDDVLKVDVDENGEGGDDYYDSGRYCLMGMLSLAELPKPVSVHRVSTSRLS